MKIECNRAWVFGNNIDTDVLAPSAYLMKSVEEMAPHCLEAIDPAFASTVQLSDAFVAGQNLGIGSSREQAPQILMLLGIRVLLAKSFARIFYRNALNLGLPALVCAHTDEIRSGDTLSIDLLAGRVENCTTAAIFDCEPLPAHLLVMIEDGGLIPHLKKKLG